jgi:CBS domain-containing protein
MNHLPVLESTIQKTHEWLKEITEGLGFPNQKAAYAALRATLHALRDRLPLQNAVQFGAQLPLVIRGAYYEGWSPVAEPSRIRHKQDFLDIMGSDLKAHDELRDYERVARIVLVTIAKHLSPGERDKVLRTLPKEIRELWMPQPEAGSSIQPSQKAQQVKMRVKDAMSKNVTWVGPELTLRQAARKMRELDIGCLPVGKDDRLIGIITDRDIACRAVAKGWDSAKKTVKEAMSKDVVYCFDDQDVAQAAEIMEKKQVHRLPVLNRRKRMVGILSLGDLALNAPNELSGEVVEAVSRRAA